MNAEKPVTIADLPKDLNLGDDRLLPSLMIRSMDEGIRIRDELFEAEANERRLQTELGHASARVELLRRRQKASGELTRSMWGALKEGWLEAKSKEADTVTPSKREESAG